VTVLPPAPFLSDAGIQIKTSKTGAELLFEWSPELRQIVTDALKIKPQVRQSIVCNRKGKSFTKNGFDSVWNRLMAKATAKGAIERFQFRDLRAKNASDETDLADAQARLGHRNSEITERVYVRTAKKVRPLR